MVERILLSSFVEAPTRFVHRVRRAVEVHIVDDDGAVVARLVASSKSQVPENTLFRRAPELLERARRGESFTVTTSDNAIADLAPPIRQPKVGRAIPWPPGRRQTAETADE